MVWNLAIAVLAAMTSSGNDVPVQQGGEQGIYQSGPLREMEQRLNFYLNGEYLKAILTPGENVEWLLDLKPGQVLVAEARADSFDAAIEIVDEAGKIVAQNDDRYPGDQRPLAFWRCEAPGVYHLRVRSYQNKAGGQVFARFNTYETLDLSSGKMTDGVFSATKPFFVRIPMKAGQIKDIVTEHQGEGNYLNFDFNTVISPNGLPERADALSLAVNPAILPLIAPLDGDYYLMYSPRGYRGGDGRVRIGTREFVPKPLTREGGSLVAHAPIGTPAVFETSVKKGDLLAVSTPELNLNCVLKVAEAPDFSGFAIDPKKPELNPFLPPLRNLPPKAGPPIDIMFGRARDLRLLIFRVNRDAKLWLSSNGAGAGGKAFAMRVEPAAQVFSEGKPMAGKLQVAKYDYWAFDANAGDVMSFNASAKSFNQVVVVRDPDLGEVRHVESSPDQTADNWRMVFQKPGRYLLQYSCLGDGGGGDYTLTRSVLPAKEFSSATPAKGDIGEGEIQIWKFKADPKKPVFVHWNSTNWGYGVAIYDDKGNATDFQRQDIDEHNRLGILKVAEPRTYVIVLTGGKEKSSYSIELNAIPGEWKK